MPEINELSKQELRSELKAAERSSSLARRRRAYQAEAASELTGFVVGTVGFGWAESRGMIPDKIGGFDSELLIGGALLFMNRNRSGKRGAMMRGAGYGLMAGALKDIGKNMAEGGSLFGGG